MWKKGRSQGWIQLFLCLSHQKAQNATNVGREDYGWVHFGGGGKIRSVCTLRETTKNRHILKYNAPWWCDCHSYYQGVKATSPSLESGKTLWPTECGRSDATWPPILASRGLAASYSYSLGKLPWDCRAKNSDLACLRMADQGEQGQLPQWGPPDQPANLRHPPPDMWLRHFTPPSPAEFLRVS